MYIVTYTGPIGFMKPYAAVRDTKTHSQQFLTPSTVEGMRRMLGVRRIVRHKVSFTGVSTQQEVTQPKGWTLKNKVYSRPRSIINRVVMLDPVLVLGFDDHEDAYSASKQHICLSRNEDILLPINLREITEAEFDKLAGFELHPVVADGDDVIMVGYNRYNDNAPMYGVLKVTA